LYCLTEAFSLVVSDVWTTL